LITVDNSSVFKGELGERLYKKVCEAIDKLSIKVSILKGVLVGFSGGADSVFLLEFLNEYRRTCGNDFKILAVHVNHSIRGSEAERDESFSLEYANSLGVEFISRTVDAKAYAKENHQSLEEAARNLRYSLFREIIRGRNDISTIAVAHNADDNFETVLFNMMRGTGLRGASGIAPVRDDIIRPLITVAKAEILELFREKGVKYVTDSTNFSLEYTRNYIRHEIIPRFSRLSDNPVSMVTRFSESLRQDNDFIETYAKEIFQGSLSYGKISVEKLLGLHPAIATRVLSYLAEPHGISLERVHITKIIELLPSGNFKLSLPRGCDFISECGECYISKHEESSEFSYKLSLGVNVFDDFEDVIVLSEKKVEETFSNIYKIAIQASFNFDIIKDGLCVRSKVEGDSYRFGSMTRKLKKLFNDKAIPPSRRADVPVFSDAGGVLWVPGFKVRDGGHGAELYVAICTPKEKSLQCKRSFYILK